jgi:uncharacterized protein
VTAAGNASAAARQQAALTLVQEQSILTLATAGQAGPWSAPVYYVCLEGRFFFFSAPDSRHIQQALACHNAAASVFHQADAWQEIRGLQMRGSVTGVESTALSLTVIARYLQRFPFTWNFFGARPLPGPDDFLSIFKARLYVFDPQAVDYTDNRFGFGSRERIDWPAG